MRGRCNAIGGAASSCGSRSSATDAGESCTGIGVLIAGEVGVSIEAVASGTCPGHPDARHSNVVGINLHGEVLEDVAVMGGVGRIGLSLL